MTEITPELREAILALNSVYETGLREDLNIPVDWKFIDSDKIPIKGFNELHEAIGDAPVRFVISSSGPYVDAPDESWIRYTAFYSPEAMEKVRAWSKERIKNNG